MGYRFSVTDLKYCSVQAGTHTNGMAGFNVPLDTV